MLKFNAIVFYIGIILTGIGMVVGLPALVLGYQSIGIIFFLNVVPFGFLLWFTGFVGYTFSRPNKHRKNSIEASKEYHRQVPD